MTDTEAQFSQAGYEIVGAIRPGVVYEAQRLSDGKTVVVKVGKDDMIAYEREVLQALGPPLAVAVLDSFPVEVGRRALVMERCDGSLFDLYKRRGFIDGDGDAVFTVLLAAVRAMKKKGLVHGNISPENTLVRDYSNLHDVCVADPLRHQDMSPGYDLECAVSTGRWLGMAPRQLLEREECGLQ